MTDECTCDHSLDWIRDERFQVNYYAALIDGDDGHQRSLWPEKWSLEYLKSMEHTRSFALNYQNQPRSADGTYWSADDIAVEPMLPGLLSRTILSIDPAVTTKRTSDFTGMAVLSHSPRSRTTDGAATGSGKVYVRDARKVKLDPKKLRLLAVEILERFPEIRVIYCEINQGGDLWADVFGDLPVKYVTKHQSVPKEVRAGWLLNGYQRRQVVHAVSLPSFDAELLAFPTGLNDDQIDAVGSGFAWLTGIGEERRAAFSGRTV